MRSVFGWIVLGWLGGWSGGAGADTDFSVSLSVVQIRAPSGPDKISFGSGVVVGPDRVATNCHVIRAARNVFAAKGPALYPALGLQRDPRHDLCLLHTPGIPFPSARLGNTRKLRVGEPLYLYGYPRALGIAYSQGRLEALHPYEGGRILRTSAAFSLGSSGGGVFDGQGRLVGLATFLTGGHSGGYFAIPVDWIERLRRSPILPVEPFGQRSFWEDTAAMPRFLKAPGQ